MKANRAKRVICIVTQHKWVYGRVAEKWARAVLPDRKNYHNRECSRCEKAEWDADKIEDEAERLRGIKRRLGNTKAQSDAELWDPMKKTIDPDEFP